jgi:restriction endonuclease S subunit
MILAHTVPAAVLQVPGTINQDMKALKPNALLTSEYLCAALWAYNSQLQEQVERSSHDTRKLETPKLLDFELPVPPLMVQAQIVQQFEDLRAKTDSLRHIQKESAAELDALLPAILDKAFRGEM